MSARTRHLILFGSLAFFGLQSVVDLLEYGSSAWIWVAGYAIASFLLIGPVIWIVRARVPAGRRKNLSYPVVGAIYLCFVLVLGLELAFGGIFLFFDAAMLGGIVGFTAAFLVERTVVPQRLRAPGNG